jgi:hypothetical protein
MSRAKVEVREVGHVDLDRITKILAGIPDGIYKASHAALKRAGERAKTEAGRFVAQEYVITKGTFMKNVTTTTDIKGGSAGLTSLSLNFRGTVIPLIEFQVKYSRGGTLSAQVKRGGGGTIQSAFAARVFGPLRVFERVGRARLPVEQKFGPSTAQMMANEKIVDGMTEVIQETFDERIEHEVWRLLSGVGG